MYGTWIAGLFLAMTVGCGPRSAASPGAGSGRAPDALTEAFVIEPEIQRLIDALRSPDGRTAHEAFEALAQRGADARGAIPSLVKLLADPSTSFTVEDYRPAANHLGPRQAFAHAGRAAGVLLAIGHDAIPALLDAVVHGNPATSRAAALVLGHLGEAGRLGSLVPSVSEHLATLLATIGPTLTIDELATLGHASRAAATARLLEVLALPDAAGHDNRAFAALALAKIDARDAVPALLRIVRTDASSLVRAFSAQALGRLDHTESTHRVLRDVLAHDPEAMVREYASGSLIDARTPTGIAALIAALTDTSPQVRLNAAHALWTIKSAASIAPLIQALTVESEYLTLDYLLHALAAQHATSAIPQIKRILGAPAKAMSHDAARRALETLESGRPPEAGFAR